MSEENTKGSSVSRRFFLGALGIGGAAIGLQQMGCSPKTTQKRALEESTPKIAGFDEVGEDSGDVHKGWTPVSERKVRVGLVGYGYSKFSARFGFQDHPNVEVVGVSDLIPERCALLSLVTGCNRTFPSLEEMVKDKSIDAIFIATDAPSHARHAILALKHGKHVAVAVPAIFGSLEEADELYETVKTSGKKYMMFETSCFREDLYAMHKIYEAGGFGKIVYSEGEYFHYGPNEPSPNVSYNNWRHGNPPMFYLTHATAYYVGVTGNSFTDISCIGKPSHLPYLQGGRNQYNNPYATQVALLRTSDGGMSRMMYSKDTPGHHAEEGRVRGERGSYNRSKKYEGEMTVFPNLKRPPLPPGVSPGGHGGAHGNLTEEFIRAILEDREPWIDVAMALNLSIPGIIGHQSCLKDGEWLKIPQYRMWT